MRRRHTAPTLTLRSLRELLTTMGDRFTEQEVWACGRRAGHAVQVEEMFRGAPVDDKGHFNYFEFTKILKHGSKDAAEESSA